MPSSACSSGCSGDRCRGDRLVHSSRPLEAAAVAEVHVALAFRGCCGKGVRGKNLQQPQPSFAPSPGVLAVTASTQVTITQSHNGPKDEGKLLNPPHTLTADR